MRARRLALFVGVLCAWPVAADALPAFARRFALGCGACHQAVPRLNAYGERFRENGYEPPGDRWVPLPGSWHDGATDFLSVWTRGEFFEHSTYAGAPDTRGGLATPERTSVYVAGSLTASTSVFLELEAVVHRTDLNARGVLANSVTGGIGKGFATLDVGALLDDDGDGPVVSVGRVAPSSDFPFPTNRQILHGVPADTSERGRLLRLPLEPYAHAAKFFGLSKRGGHLLLPTEAVLYGARAAPGVDVSGRVLGSRLLYQLGVTSGASPEFGDGLHAPVPYAVLRRDFGTGAPFGGSLALLGTHGSDVYRVAFRERAAVRQSDLDVWRAGAGGNLRRGPWDLYGAWTWDRVSGVPAALDRRFARDAHGLTAALDYRALHALLASLRYDWMDAGGVASDVLPLPGPRRSQVLHLQLRWYLFEGDDLARVPIPALMTLSLRDSVNLTPGGAHPFGNWRNAVLLGFDFAF